MKHAKYFTDEKDIEGADAKKVVHFHDCGSLFMTDGAVGLFALNAHDKKDSARTPLNAISNIKPMTLDKIISLVGAALTIEDSAIIKANIDVEALLKFTHAVINASKCDDEDEKKDDPLLNINLKVGRGLMYEQHGAVLSSIYTDNEITPSEDVTGATLNAKNLEKVLKVLNKLGHDDVQLLITGRFRPIEIRTYDCVIRTVVMPVRTY